MVLGKKERFSNWWIYAIVIFFRLINILPMAIDNRKSATSEML
jgi:hypothetical protein